jgi:disulfide oxidoreductase YuzD
LEHFFITKNAKEKKYLTKLLLQKMADAHTATFQEWYKSTIAPSRYPKFKGAVPRSAPVNSSFKKNHDLTRPQKIKRNDFSWPILIIEIKLINNGKNL